MDVLQTFEPGRVVQVKYQGERLWHQRLLILPSTAIELTTITGEAVVAEEKDLWWALTPDRDLYPQQLAPPFLAGVVILDDEGQVVPETLRGSGSRLGQV